MPRTRLAALALLSTLCLGSCGGPPDPQADLQAIRAFIERAEALNNQGDLDGWVALFEEGAIYMPPGRPTVTTRAELLEIARAGFTRWRTEIQLTPEEIVVEGDWAFARLLVTGNAMPIEGGDPRPIDTKEMVIYHRQADGGWKVARLIGNSNR